MLIAVAIVLLVALLSDVDVALTFDRQRKQFDSQSGINQPQDEK